MSDPDDRPTSPRGFSTRAIRAASRIPHPQQTPTSVPIYHPPSTSHRQSSEAEFLDAGITPGLLRVSVRREDVEDLEADFAEALAAAARTTRASTASAV